MDPKIEIIVDGQDGSLGGVVPLALEQLRGQIDYFATHFCRPWGISAVFTDPAGVKDPVYLPTGQLTAFYSKHHGDRLVRAETSGVPTYEQPYRMGGIGHRKAVAALDVLATAGKTAVFVHAINRSFDKALEVTIDLSGFQASDGAVHRLVQGRLNDTPQEGQPAQIGYESTHQIPGSPRPLKVTLPERSVSCIEIPLASLENCRFRAFCGAPLGVEWSHVRWSRCSPRNMDAPFGRLEGVGMSLDKCEGKGTPRREFLSQLSLALAGSALALGRTSAGGESSTGGGDSAAPVLPTIQLGPHRVTRLIAGSNPIHGYSYMGSDMDRQMREYFTDERTTEFLWQCEHAGINTHQFSSIDKMAGIFQTLRQRGAKMKFICLHAGGGAPIDQVVRDTRPIAVAHHGGVTDRLFRSGKSDEVHDFVKRVHDAGVLAGVSAHNPDCIKRMADEGWKVDFFMACFYYLTRTPEELKKMPIVETLGSGYSFFDSDPPVMTAVMRQVDVPCLGFKILGAGRKCRDRQMVQDAFQFAFEHIKPTDGVIVGMYPRHGDQIGENTSHAREAGENRIEPALT